MIVTGKELMILPTEELVKYKLVISLFGNELMVAVMVDECMMLKLVMR